MPKQEPKGMPWAERKARFGDQAWTLVQANKGGGATVPTKAYPTYERDYAAKPAPPVHPKQPTTNSSPTSWNSQGWTKYGAQLHGKKKGDEKATIRQLES